MKKITFENIVERFADRDDIEICKDGFNGWKKKSKFYDKVEGDYFWAIPKNVYYQKSCHPKRATRKRKNTNIKKYGNPCSLHGNTKEARKVKQKTKETNLKRYGAESPVQSEKIKIKIKQTFVEKYGVENPLHVKEIKQKRKETIRKKYGVEHPMQTPDTKKKHKETLRKNYGVDHPTQSEKIKTKIKTTLKKRYGVESPFQLPGVYNKRNKTMLQKYGTTNSWLNTTKIISDINVPLIEWYKTQPEPKPLYGWLVNNFKGQSEVTLAEVQDVLNSFKQSKTTLEVLSEQLFEARHYNKNPKNIDSLYRPDFKLSDSVFVNVDGLYWHSELQKEKWYHFKLRQEFEAKGMRIFQFREDELRTKPEIVKSIVDNALGTTPNRLFARKTTIKKISQKEADCFLENNHLMGSTRAKHIGLFYNDDLVSVLSWKCRGKVCKIERFCSKRSYIIIGAFSKLIKHLERECISSDILELHNWVDLRYGTGAHLLNKKFYLVRETLGWKWTDGTKTFNRLKCRANMDDRKMSQAEHASELGWYKIYDAGQRLYVKTLSARNSK